MSGWNFQSLLFYTPRLYSENFSSLARHLTPKNLSDILVIFSQGGLFIASPPLYTGQSVELRYSLNIQESIKYLFSVKFLVCIKFSFLSSKYLPNYFCGKYVSTKFFVRQVSIYQIFLVSSFSPRTPKLHTFLHNAYHYWG